MIELLFTTQHEWPVNINREPGDNCIVYIFQTTVPSFPPLIGEPPSSSEATVVDLY
jgi:hypothetical protein